MKFLDKSFKSESGRIFEDELVAYVDEESHLRRITVFRAAESALGTNGASSLIRAHPDDLEELWKALGRWRQCRRKLEELKENT